MIRIEQGIIPPEVDLSIDPRVIRQAERLLGADPDIERARAWIHSPEKRERERRIARAIFTCLWPVVTASRFGVLVADGRPSLYNDTVAFPGPNQKLINPVKITKIRTLKENASAQKRDPFETTVFQGSRKKEHEGIDPRAHRFGGILRKTGLDESPQLLSVIKGQMALVGPRGYTLREIEGLYLLLEEVGKDKGLENYLDIMSRVAPLPGIAGLYAAIHKKDLTPIERLLLDLLYCLCATEKGDKRILAYSFIATVKGTGAR